MNLSISILRHIQRVEFCCCPAICRMSWVSLQGEFVLTTSQCGCELQFTPQPIQPPFHPTFSINAERSIFIQLSQSLAVATEAELWQHLRSKLVSQRQIIFFFTLSEGHFNKPCNFEDHSAAKVQKKICPCCHPKVSAICRPFSPYFLTFDVFSVYLPELHERRGRPGEVPCLLEELELVISESAVMQKTSLLHHAILPCPLRLMVQSWLWNDDGIES